MEATLSDKEVLASLETWTQEASLNNGYAVVENYPVKSLHRAIKKVSDKFEKDLSNIRGKARYRNFTSKKRVFKEILNLESQCQEAQIIPHLTALSKSSLIKAALCRLSLGIGDSPYHYAFYYFAFFLDNGKLLKFYYRWDA